MCTVSQAILLGLLNGSYDPPKCSQHFEQVVVVVVAAAAVVVPAKLECGTKPSTTKH